MKKVIMIITFCVSFLNVIAQQDSLRGKMNIKEKKYCAVMKENKLLVMNEGNEITGPVNFPSGAKILIDGTYIQNDGVAMKMTPGECVDKDGNLIKLKDDPRQSGTDEKILKK